MAKQKHPAPQRASRSCTKVVSYREPSTDGEEENEVALPPRRSNPSRSVRHSSHTRKRKLPIGYTSDSNSDDEPTQIHRKKRRVASEDKSTLEPHSSLRRVLRSSTLTRPEQLTDSSNAQDSDDELLVNTHKNHEVANEDALDSDGELLINTHRKPEVANEDVQSHVEAPFRRVLRSNGAKKQSDLAYADEESQSESQSSDDDYRQCTRKKRGTVARARSTPSNVEIVVHSAQDSVRDESIIPDWASLPYSILCQIFHYASVPLLNERFQATDSAKWLLDTALVCRSFTEPCLHALYETPPLAQHQAHLLVQHLKANQNAMSMNYRTKIETIKFEAHSTAVLSFSGFGTLDLHGLIRNSTRLKDLEIYHEKDFAPYDDLEFPIRWSYPAPLFDALDEEWTEEVDELDRKTNQMVTTFRKHGPIKLRSWRWNARLAGEKQELCKLQALHLTPKFHDLQKVAFVHYRPSKVAFVKQESKDEHKKKAEIQFSNQIQALAGAIQALPNLQHLVLESCTLVTKELLLMLPSSLRVLEIINCKELEAEDLAAYLDKKGQHLQELLLSHNEALTLSFLPKLSEAYRLEVLRVTLHHDPLYKDMLLDTEVPTWPSSLRIIEIDKLCHWEIGAMEIFFQSIVDNAANLLNLRRLIIKANISLGWKVRAGIRQKWEETMQKVFCSRRPPPNPSWTSIKAMQSLLKGGVDLEAAQVDATNEENEGELDDSGLSAAPTLTRFQADDDDDSLPLERPKRSTRSAVTYNESESSDEDEPVPPSTPTYATGYGELASPPRTAGKAGAEDDDEEPIRPKLSRELAALHATAGQNRIRSDNTAFLLSSPAPTAGVDSDSDESQNRGRSTSMYVEPFIQGMCDKVDVTIGNLRPREMVFREKDFVGGDEDDSGDEDWDGDDDVPGDDEIAF